MLGLMNFVYFMKNLKELGISAWGIKGFTNTSVQACINYLDSKPKELKSVSFDFSTCNRVSNEAI